MDDNRGHCDLSGTTLSERDYPLFPGIVKLAIGLTYYDSNFNAIKMKKVQIPQFLDYQVKVHGLTARQYFILLVGVVISASCWQSFSSTQRPLAIASVGASVAVMLLVAFVRIAGRMPEEWMTVI